MKDYWRFEWQYRGSPHVHGLALISDAPDVYTGGVFFQRHRGDACYSEEVH